MCNAFNLTSPVCLINQELVKEDSNIKLNLTFLISFQKKKTELLHSYKFSYIYVFHKCFLTLLFSSKEKFLIQYAVKVD